MVWRINLFKTKFSVCVAMSLQPWRFTWHQIKAPKHNTVPLVPFRCGEKNALISLSLEWNTLIFTRFRECSLLNFSIFYLLRELRSRDGGRGQKAFWQDLITQPCSRSCLAIAVGNLTTWQSWRAELLVFVKVVICETLIYWLWGCVSAERRPLLTDFYARSSHKRSTAPLAHSG